VLLEWLMQHASSQICGNLQAEKEADVIIWDGGNNDTPFYKPGPQLLFNSC
jgi:imidazolonepropionase-like amidohydrolase